MSQERTSQPWDKLGEEKPREDKPDLDKPGEDEPALGKLE